MNGEWCWAICQNRFNVCFLHLQMSLLWHQLPTNNWDVRAGVEADTFLRAKISSLMILCFQNNHKKDELSAAILLYAKYLDISKNPIIYLYVHLPCRWSIFCISTCLSQLHFLSIVLIECLAMLNIYYRFPWKKILSTYDVLQIVQTKWLFKTSSVQCRSWRHAQSSWFFFHFPK